jgi:hypothetical protein
MDSSDKPTVLLEYYLKRLNRAIRIINKLGEVMFAEEADQVGSRVDISDPVCQVCHVQTPPLVQPDLHKRIYQEIEGNDEHLLRMMTPILNEARCSAAACHYHPAEEKVLGVLEFPFPCWGKTGWSRTSNAAP